MIGFIKYLLFESDTGLIYFIYTIMVPIFIPLLSVFNDIDIYWDRAIWIYIVWTPITIIFIYKYIKWKKSNKDK
jgi:hypothetical protein